ncbi:hypothetical protein PGT21_018650 [Puccinia graminis f. sp. tritici]|uniref:Uncharacterized protein n=1 Tax=Puccinia graminis f. sp. tritici TaxID=56615 RepID=A0A5B0QWJ4_PUCGR|nr:hypothetical protein PGT21_018650 [Puccinia graminis f. sp. tritici]
MTGSELVIEALKDAGTSPNDRTAGTNCLDQQVRRNLRPACPRSPRTWLSDQMSNELVRAVTSWSISARTGGSDFLSADHVRELLRQAGRWTCLPAGPSS